MQERLRLELLRRIRRGSLSVSLLARQTGFGQPHLSSFLRHRRQLSIDAMDRILAAQHLTVPDLLPVLRQSSFWPENEPSESVPVVSPSTALWEPTIRPSAAEFMLHLPPNSLQSIHPRASQIRRNAWHRFVAVRVPATEAAPMEPLVLPEALALIDRHYTSLLPYRPNRPNLYAIRHLSRLSLRYVEFLANRLVLRPYNVAFPVELAELEPGETPNDPLAGRVVLILNEI